MKSKRIAVICSSEMADWQSCKVIAPNLAKSYGLAFKQEAKFFSCAHWQNPSDIQRVAKNIFEYAPNRIVFLDYTPHPDALLRALRALYKTQELPLIYIHVYGDFTRNIQAWAGLEKILSHARVFFICASHRHAKLVSKFLQSPKSNIMYCPFPVNPKTYSYDVKKRQLWRTDLGIKPEELLFVYAGRMSFQKNNIRLAEEIFHFAERSRRKTHFVLAGSFDDLGAPLFGISHEKGTSQNEWKKYLKTLSHKKRQMIRHLGDLSSSELCGLYNAADIFSSLSLYHDEDFGMAPAEALCAGTPCALTDWGGYASFKLAAPVLSCQLISLQLKSRGVEISSPSVQESFLNLSNLDRSQKTRQMRSQFYLKNFSIKTVSKRIQKIHSLTPPRFNGFSFDAHNYAPSYGDSFLKGGYYEKIYGSYLSG